MKHEKIFKRPDGSKVRVSVRLYTSIYPDSFNYEVTLDICKPKKRLFEVRGSTYTPSRLGDATDLIATHAEITDTVLEFYQLISPSSISITVLNPKL